MRLVVQGTVDLGVSQSSEIMQASRDSMAGPFPECLDDWIDENNPVRVIDAFALHLDGMEMSITAPLAIWRVIR
jgi:hypothetical protein